MNLEKCAFMVYYGTIIGFIVSKEGNTLDPKKIKALIKMLVPETPQEFKCSMEWHNFINVSLENLLLFGTNYQVAQEN
jgi:hypothetical protein